MAVVVAVDAAVDAADVPSDDISMQRPSDIRRGW